MWPVVVTVGTLAPLSLAALSSLVTTVVQKSKYDLQPIHGTSIPHSSQMMENVCYNFHRNAFSSYWKTFPLTVYGPPSQQQFNNPLVSANITTPFRMVSTYLTFYYRWSTSTTSCTSCLVNCRYCYGTSSDIHEHLHASTSECCRIRTRRLPTTHTGCHFGASFVFYTLSHVLSNTGTPLNIFICFIFILLFKYFTI
jgi:hypothetical protein